MTSAPRPPGGAPEPGSAHDAAPAQALAGAADLFGQLLLFELDPARLARFAAPEVARALAELGVDVPELETAPDFDVLAAEFYAQVLQPEKGGPLVQSLWTQGAYEGDAAVQVRRLAAAAGFELDAEHARGAAPDHLGSLLLLWSATHAAVPEVAARIAQEHLAWSRSPLGTLARGTGFYAQVGRATARLIDQLVEPRAAGSLP